MNESFEDPRAAQNTVRRYERMVAHDEATFFDLEEFEIIIDYYVTSAAFDKAQQACEVALSQYPFSTELLIDRAQISAMRGDYTEAERQISNVASLDPDNADVAVTRGIIATQRGDFEEAVRFFQAALAQNPDREDIHFNLGLAYQSWQKYKSAARHYKHSLRLHPDNETTVQELLNCLEASNRLPEHEEFFQRFTDDDPYSAVAWYNLGQYYYRLEKYEQAAASFD
ncbi:MAG: tetratricopeptide repeat protein, partial [Cytophagaceae bacterium]